MADKSTKMLLIAVIVLLGLLLLRPVIINPAQAQSPLPVQTQPVMVVDNATLYVLSNNKIYVYYWDNPQTAKLRPQIGTVKLLQTLDAKLKP